MGAGTEDALGSGPYGLAPQGGPGRREAWTRLVLVQAPGQGRAEVAWTRFVLVQAPAHVCGFREGVGQDVHLDAWRRPPATRWF